MTPPVGPPRRPAALAAFFSFVIPGLGQAFVGAWRRGLLLAAPLIALAILIVLGMGQGGARLLGLAIQPRVLLAAFLVNLAVFAWRLFATGDAFRLAKRLSGTGRRTSAGELSVLAVLVIVLGLTHGWVAVVTYKAYDTMSTVAVTATPTPQPSLAPLSPGETPGPTPEPTPAGPAWAADGRLDLLLIGSDSGPGRISMRTDSMTLLSVDIATGRAAMFGIPRNLRNAPLPPYSVNAFACRCYPDLLNSMFGTPVTIPSGSTATTTCGVTTRSRKRSPALVGRSIDGMVILDLNGFVRLVNALGGLDIYLPVGGL